MNIAIRVDGNKKLGMGNLYRSIAIANELINRNQNVYFITKGFSESIKVLQDFNFSFFLLSSSEFSKSYDNEICEIVRQNDVKLLINDIKDTDETYMKLLKSLKIFIVNFDDIGKGRNYANILFDAFYNSKLSDLNPFEKYGPKYLILRKEFQNKFKHSHSKKVNSITVLMGSSNTGNFLQKILKALSFLPEDIECNFILSNSTDQAVNFQTDFNKKNFNFYYQPENISELFFNSDLAITAGGISMCETCAVGTPTLVIPQVPHEDENAKFFAENGAVSAINYDPDLSEEKILTHVNKLINDYEIRNELSQRSKKLIDGKGIERVISVLEPFLIENN